MRAEALADNKETKQEPDGSEVFEKIYENYQDLNRKMVNELNLSSIHGGLTGHCREEMWLNFFRGIIPQKFSLAQGVIIIDAYGNASREVDIAVYDEQYTPYVFRYNMLKFIPIEAVAVVIECKSVDPGNKQLTEWAKSIDALRTCRAGIARMATGYFAGLNNPTQTGTRPIKILACLKEVVRDGTWEACWQELQQSFDFIIAKKKDKDKYFELVVANKQKNLGWWGQQLNGISSASNDLQGLALERDIPESDPDSYKGLIFAADSSTLVKNTLADLEIEGNPILSLNLQLNQLLMLINNPMLFPHFAYAQQFNDIANLIKEKRQKQPHCEAEQNA
ncbi:DUF6602 domain-containing protein [Sporomusa termitida]|uniref:DUF6602 domain-containing protein n=1 Tax=Sporomusa termitida TaxID=2377 RepID=A0A517DNH8_9FIRM|nr:DUF6602 domain-containing protein [Sporomusa termitida]QDR78920.1 hypothetical protein SPTER_01710 [Sporomusa termitida]